MIVQTVSRGYISYAWIGSVHFLNATVRFVQNTVRLLHGMVCMSTHRICML